MKIPFKDLNVINHPYTTLLHKQPYRVCSKTIMDTSDIDIQFDKDGVINHYYLYQDFKKEWYTKSQEILMDSVKKIKRKKNKEYDCILGISGGR